MKEKSDIDVPLIMKYGKMIIYTSRQLKNREKNNSTHDLGLAAMIYTLKVWHH